MHLQSFSEENTGFLCETPTSVCPLPPTVQPHSNNHNARQRPWPDFWPLSATAHGRLSYTASSSRIAVAPAAISPPPRSSSAETFLSSSSFSAAAAVRAVQTQQQLLLPTPDWDQGRPTESASRHMESPTAELGDVLLPNWLQVGHVPKRWSMRSMSMGGYCQPTQLSLWSPAMPLEADMAMETDQLLPATGLGMDRLVAATQRGSDQVIARRASRDQRTTSRPNSDQLIGHVTCH